MRGLTLITLAVFTLTAAAQKPVLKPAPGTVTGTVLCADSHAPPATPPSF